VLTTVQKWSEIPEVENSLVTILVQWLDCVHVPAFFFCSGYLYFGKALSTVRECIQFVVKKIINLGIPYISFSFLYVFLSGVGKNWGGTGYIQ
jgi:fucose 4-O-acetylase-like acetyltransferase